MASAMKGTEEGGEDHDLEAGEEGIKDRGGKKSQQSTIIADI